MSFHGRNEHLKAKKKMMAHEKRSARTRANAKHQAQVKAVIESVTKKA